MNEYAFPSVGGEVASLGMTLRDYFAAKALAALIAGPDVMRDHYEDQTNEDSAVRAYFIADAMLKARDKSNESFYG